MSEFKQKIIVSGFAGGGKSTFFRLIDGHPLLLGTQVYERFPRLFYLGREELIKRSSQLNTRLQAQTRAFPLEWNGATHALRLSVLRTLLTKHTGYGQIEEDADNKRTYTGVSSTDHSFLSFNFDFEKFERQWKAALFDSPATKTPERVIDIFYKSFFESWVDYPVRYSEAKYVVFCGAEEPEELSFAMENNFDCKVIFINRDVRGLLATHILRSQEARVPLPKGCHSYNDLILKNGVLERLFSRRDHALQHAVRNPHQFIVLDFEELVINPEPCMRRIAEFLEISYDANLIVPSHLRVPIFEGKYIGKVNDQWQSVLRPRDLAALELYEKGFKAHPRSWRHVSTALLRRTARKLKSKAVAWGN